MLLDPLIPIIYLRFSKTIELDYFVVIVSKVNIDYKTTGNNRQIPDFAVRGVASCLSVSNSFTRQRISEIL